MGWRLDYFVTSQRLQSCISQVQHQINVKVTAHCPIVMKCNLKNYLRTPAKTEEKQKFSLISSTNEQVSEINKVKLPLRSLKL